MYSQQNVFQALIKSAETRQTVCDDPFVEKSLAGGDMIEAGREAISVSHCRRTQVHSAEPRGRLLQNNCKLPAVTDNEAVAMTTDCNGVERTRRILVICRSELTFAFK